MNEYEYTPPKNTKKMTGLSMILVSVAAAFFFIPILFPTMPFQWIMQFAGILCLVGVIFIISRCVAKTFVYTVAAGDDGTPDFTVTELQNGGKSKITVCRVSVGNIERSYLLYPENKEDKKKEKELYSKARAEGRKSFDYCHDISPSPVCILLLEECGEPLLLKISPDEKMYSMLKKEETQNENT